MVGVCPQGVLNRYALLALEIASGCIPPIYCILRNQNMGVGWGVSLVDKYIVKKNWRGLCSINIVDVGIKITFRKYNYIKNVSNSAMPP